MTNLARFTIAGTPSSQGGYDVSPSATPVLALEGSSSLVGRVTFEYVTATDGAPALTLNNGVTTGAAVDAVTPSSTVTISAGIPTVRAPHLWALRCKVNGGTNPDGSVNPDYVFTRFIAMRNSLGRRKILYSERGEYSPTMAWAEAFNGLIDDPIIFNPGGIVPMSLFAISQDWASVYNNVLVSPYQTAVGDYPIQTEVTHLMREGTSLTGVSMAILPATHATNLPATMPHIVLSRCSATDVSASPTLTVIFTGTDSSANVTAYNQAHLVTGVALPAHLVSLGAYRYFIEIFGENGANSEVGMLVSRVNFLVE